MGKLAHSGTAARPAARSEPAPRSHRSGGPHRRTGPRIALLAARPEPDRAGQPIMARPGGGLSPGTSGPAGLWFTGDAGRNWSRRGTPCTGLAAARSVAPAPPPRTARPGDRRDQVRAQIGQHRASRLPHLPAR